MDAIESNIGTHGTEIIQQSDKPKLEETCVMVSGEELHFVHHTVANYKPYKVVSVYFFFFLFFFPVLPVALIEKLFLEKNSKSLHFENEFSKEARIRAACFMAWTSYKVNFGRWRRV